MRGAKIPVLAVDYTGRGAVVGEPIILLGYPAGVGAIFAKTDPEIVRQLLTCRLFLWCKNYQIGV